MPPLGTGITLNEYQVQRGNELARAQRLDHLYRSVQGDFMNLPFGVRGGRGRCAEPLTILFACRFA